MRPPLPALGMQIAQGRFADTIALARVAMPVPACQFRASTFPRSGGKSRTLHVMGIFSGDWDATSPVGLKV
jgi:hypothetical protein